MAERSGWEGRSLHSVREGRRRVLGLSGGGLVDEPEDPAGADVSCAGNGPAGDLRDRPDARAGQAELGLVEYLVQHLLLAVAGGDKGRADRVVEHGIAAVSGAYAGRVATSGRRCEEKQPLSTCRSQAAQGSTLT